MLKLIFRMGHTLYSYIQSSFVHVKHITHLQTVNSVYTPTFIRLYGDPPLSEKCSLVCLICIRTTFFTLVAYVGEACSVDAHCEVDPALDVLTSPGEPPTCDTAASKCVCTVGVEVSIVLSGTTHKACQGKHSIHLLLTNSVLLFVVVVILFSSWSLIDIGFGQYSCYVNVKFSSS